jgi:hypothetical protein
MLFFEGLIQFFEPNFIQIKGIIMCRVIPKEWGFPEITAPEAGAKGS